MENVWALLEHALNFLPDLGASLLESEGLVPLLQFLYKVFFAFVFSKYKIGSQCDSGNTNAGNNLTAGANVS